MRFVPFIILLTLVTGCVTPGADDASPVTADVTRPGAVLETGFGTITLVLYPEFAPETVAQFTTLAEDGFYDDTIWHRVVKDFVIQTGDGTTGTGAAGHYETVPLERHPDAYFAAGSVGLARNVPEDSGSSQFFITEKPQPHLHEPRSDVHRAYGAFTKFADVVAGMDVVRAIASVDTIPTTDRPVEDVPLEHVTVRDVTLPSDAARDLPLQVFEPVREGEDATALLDAPLARAVARPTPVTFYAEDADGARPFDDPRVRVTVGDATLEAPLTRLPDDPAVARGNVTVPEAGTHTVTLVDGDALIATFEVDWS